MFRQSDREATFTSIAEDRTPAAHPPYLRAPPSKPYTLVLDLDETLVHYRECDGGGGQFLVRPHAEHFLRDMSQHYELVIFAAAMLDYANFILDLIDRERCIGYKLYREHTRVQGDIHIKVWRVAMYHYSLRTSRYSAGPSRAPSSSTTSPRTSSCSPRTVSSSRAGLETRTTGPYGTWARCS